MNSILSVVKNGRVEVDAPDWPDGTPVRVELGLTCEAADEERTETVEEIEEWIRRFRAIEAIEITPAEEAAWQADRQAQKDFDIANAAERDRRLDEIFP